MDVLLPLHLHAQLLHAPSILDEDIKEKQFTTVFIARNPLGPGLKALLLVS